MSKPAPITQMIRRIVDDQRVRALSDRELVRLFRAEHDEAAFHGLIRRHGNMVLDVCRNVLGNEADADDAFQATFLALARKASTIRESSSVGSWLYGVAYRTALKARAAGARRSRHERGKANETVASTSDDLSWRDVQATIHAELSRLSESYRSPLVLCYLEGKTQDQAAVMLGISKGALKKHLEAARALLRVRLLRRGIGTAAMLVAGSWPGAKAAACVPPALAVKTVAGAMAIVTGQTAAGLAWVHLSALTERVVNAMFLTKLRTVVVMAVALGMVPMMGGLAHWPDGSTALAAADSEAPIPDQDAPDANKGKAGDALENRAPILQLYTVKDGSAETLRAKLREIHKGNSSIKFAPIGNNQLMVLASPADQALIAGQIQEPKTEGNLEGEWTGPMRPLPSWYKELADKSGQVPLFAWYKAGKDLEEFKKWDRNDDGFIAIEEVITGSGAGAVRLIFRDKENPKAPGSKLQTMRWTPPPLDIPGLKTVNRPPVAGGLGAGAGGGGVSQAAFATMPHGIGGMYSVKESGGKRSFVLQFLSSGKKGQPEEFEVPFKINGDTLTLEGGMIEVGARGNFPPIIKAELKGTWRRVDVALEKKLLDAFPGIELDRYPIKLELKESRLLIAAQQVLLNRGKTGIDVSLGECAVARYADAKGATSSDAARQTTVTTVRSTGAILRLPDMTPPRDALDHLLQGGILSIEFADGVRIDFKERKVEPGN